jgi:hypothetical protein
VGEDEAVVLVLAYGGHGQTHLLGEGADGDEGVVDAVLGVEIGHNGPEKLSRDI